MCSMFNIQINYSMCIFNMRSVILMFTCFTFVNVASGSCAQGVAMTKDWVNATKWVVARISNAKGENLDCFMLSFCFFLEKDGKFWFNMCMICSFG
jgi:hypothetical protein